jgi:hypothetical protein
VHGAVAFSESPENDAEQPVCEGQDAPGNEAGCQKRTRKAQETKDGNHREKPQGRRCTDVALQRKALQGWSTVGHENPRYENHGQTDAGIHSGANRRVLENVEPAIAREMSADSNQSEAPKSLPKFITRIYEEGCATSAATGAEGALSLPERSTAVTEYQ